MSQDARVVAGVYNWDELGTLYTCKLKIRVSNISKNDSPPHGTTEV